MNIKDIQAFRTWSLEGESPETHDQNFVGHSHRDTRKWGFFKVYHGKKANVAGFLHKEVEMAEDGQSIYEFIQNAADCGSTHFWMFFDETQFLVINNGAPFTASGIASILNVGQSDGKDTPGKIGRFGIGFKLVHRLVGAASGLPEMMKDYAGPVLFSWSQPAQFASFRQQEEALSPSPYDPMAAASGTGDPWLLKILLTCFPALPGEEVRDLDYQLRRVFPDDELAACRSFLDEHTSALDPDLFQNGSLFYLRLGAGKAEKLRSEMELLRSGVSSSMHFLGNLRYIQIQQQPVSRLQSLQMESFEIAVDSPDRASIPLTDKRDLESPVQLIFGFPPVGEATQLLRNEPSFYKYFPAGDETAPYTFILHSNVVSVESNRRKLHVEAVNQKLLQLAASQLQQRYLDLIADSDEQPLAGERARRIWGSLVLTDPPTGNHEWQRVCFYTPLLDIARSLVPTIDGFAPADKVRIRRTALPVTPADLGLDDFWFHWPYDSEIAHEAALPEKTGLSVWKVENLLSRPGDTAALVRWLDGLPAEMQPVLRKELSEVSAQAWSQSWVKTDKTTFALYQRFAELALFPGPDGTAYNLQRLRTDPLLLLLEGVHPEVQSVLEQLGFTVVRLNEQWKGAIYNHIRSQIIWLDPVREAAGNQVLLQRICDRTPASELNIAAKLRLIAWLKARTGLGPATLRRIVLFRNALGEQRPLDKLIAPSVALPQWLLPFRIHPEEYAGALDEFLLKPSECYMQVIHSSWPHWKDLLMQQTSPAADTEDFFHLICDWYEVSPEKTPLPGGQGALTADYTFLPEKELFYTPLLKNVTSSYEEVSAAVESLYQLRCPGQMMLPWLERYPFRLNHRRLGDLRSFKPVVLSLAQVEGLLELAQAEGTDLSKHMTVQQESESSLLLTPRHNGRPRPFYAPAGSAISVYLAAYHADEFHAIPAALAGSLGREAEVLRNEELWLALIQATPDTALFRDDLLQLLREENRPAVIRSWLKKMGELQIELQEEYPAENPDRILLELAARHLPAGEHPAFRRRLWMTAPGINSFTLDRIAQADEIGLNMGEDKRIVLRRSALLPKADGQGEAVNQLAHRLGSSPEINTLLGLNADHDLGQLQQDLLAELVSFSNTVQNATQLAFVLLTARYATALNTRNITGQVRVYAHSGEAPPLSGTWLLLPMAFINSGRVLSDRYSELPTLLKGEKLPWEVAGSFTLLRRPELTASGLRTPGLRSDLSEGEQEYLLDFLFRQWSDRLARSGSQDLPADWTRLTQELTFRQVLGFEPAALVLVPGLALPEEQPGVWLSAWAGGTNAGQKTEFLRALGATVTGTPLAVLRQAFLSPFSEPVLALLAPFSSRSATLLRQLINTVQWLNQSQTAITSEAARELFRELLRLIPISSYQLNLFAYLSALDETGNPTYQLSPGTADAYLLDPAAKLHLQQHNLTVSEILPLVAGLGCRVLDLEIYPKDADNNWCARLGARELRVVTEFNRAILQQDSSPVELPVWQETTQTRIHVFPSALPQLRDILSRSLSVVSLEPLWFDQNERVIYVTESRLPELPDLLAARYATTFSEPVRAQLRQELLSQRDAALRKAEERIKELEAALATKDGNEALIQLSGKKRPTSSLSVEETARLSADAKAAVRAALTAAGYNTAGWREDYTSIHGVTRNGQNIPIVVKGAGAGVLRMTPAEWLYLAGSPQAQLFVFARGTGVWNISLQEVEERNREFFLQFDMNRQVITEIKAFAEYFRYSPFNPHFVFDSPGFSHADDFNRSFGLYERHQPLEGEVVAADLSVLD